MLPKIAITGLTAAALVIGIALSPTGASAQRGGGGFHGGGGGFGGGGLHAGGGFGGGSLHAGGGFGGGGLHAGGGFHRGVGFRGYRGRFGRYYPWGDEYYSLPYEYYYGPLCGYVHVKYYHHKRVYWRRVYVCE